MLLRSFQVRLCVFLKPALAPKARHYLRKSNIPHLGN